MIYLVLLCATSLGFAVLKVAMGIFNAARPLFSGWLTIPKAFRPKAPSFGKEFGVQSIELGFGNIPSMKFEGCVVVHLSKTDIYLEYIGMMSSIYPLIKLPIEQMKIYRAHSMWPDAIQVSLSDPACPNFFFENPISDALYQAKINLSPEFG